MKTALITYKKSFGLKSLIDHKRKLNYDRYFILTQNSTIDKKELRNYKKFDIVVCKCKDIPEIINQIFENHKHEYKLIPFFRADAFSKYAIKVYNKAYDLKVDPKSFRLKSRMNEFLGEEVVKKKTLKFTYEEIKKAKFQSLQKKLGDTFILKPVNGVSSLLNFKISSAKQLSSAVAKLKKKYKYVVEEYLEGNLYSIDFFCDGENIFLLCFVREIPFLELLEKLSPEYMKKYQRSLKEEFLHFLPIRYTLDLKKLTPLELDFIKRIGDKLIQKKYHGYIHLEYKVKRKEDKIGFIEWAARLGGKRAEFIEGMHGVRVENLQLDILNKKDYSHFDKKKGLYFLKNKNIDKNFLMIYTSVFEKTHIMNVLSKIPDYLNVSFEDFLKSYLWDNWKIRIKTIVFYLMTSQGGHIYPFYERSDTKINYIMEFEEESFKRFLKKKTTILEHLVFHDYKL